MLAAHTVLLSERHTKEIVCPEEAESVDDHDIDQGCVLKICSCLESAQMEIRLDIQRDEPSNIL